ncbi:MAG TPA: carboxy terminal-processing peptidase [Bacteroidales bacterium]|nr:carboxy terminal-processing peptidase [Bacteroidales bacterium]
MKILKIRPFSWLFNLTLVLVLLITLASYTFCHREDKDQILLLLITNTLEQYHYSPKELNDSFSENVFNEYLKNLDYSKRFFTKEDISKFQVYKTKIDDQIAAGSVEFYKTVSNAFSANVEKVKGYYTEILSNPFDFKSNETYETNSEKTEFPASDQALKESWRKSLKYQVLVRIDDALKAQENYADSAKKTFDQLEKDARKQLLKSHNDWFKRIKENKDIDNYSIFLNSMITVFDPHSQYQTPKDKKNFDIRMSGQLEGIGAMLQADEGYIKIVDIVPGSPSWLQGELKVNDKIMKVAQQNAEAVDIYDMPIDDVVDMIRGKKGTKVTLTVKRHIDGTIKNITITRDVVIIEESYARSAIIGDKEKIGYIYLPNFYANFEQTSTGRSSSVDVANEVVKLKNENVKGIILDLRNNGGGSLPDAIQMAGLFIKQGPIVQVKTNTGPARVYNDPDKNVLFEGGLVVLVNSFSASASEILAAAMQDYNRAIIMGGASTFGKGTVQTVVELDDIISPTYAQYKPLGSMLVTIQKFYRINGGATQLKGVVPDIIFPDIYSEIETGEREQDFALPWTKINPAPYTAFPNAAKFKQVVDTESKSIASNPTFNVFREQAQDLKKQRNQTEVTLNYEKYKKQEAETIAKRKKYEELVKQTNGLAIRALLADEAKIKNDTAALNRSGNWIKDLQKDLYLKEAAKVVEAISK